MSYPTAPIDLRSDTVTRPSDAMRRAMAEAPVGDDVYREDPTIERLQEMVADMLGKEAALYVPSGTMSNQLCLRTLTHMGDEVIVPRGRARPSLRGRVGGRSVRSAAPPGAREHGVLSPEAVDATIRPAGEHFAHTGAVEMENTHNRCGGTIWPLEAMQAVAGLARERGPQGPSGRRAAVERAHGHRVSRSRTTLPPPTRCRCASPRGSGRPVGSCAGGLVRVRGEGAEQSQAVRRSHAAGRDHRGRRRLRARAQHRRGWSEDHENAAVLASYLLQVPGLEIHHPVQTNIVIADVVPVGRGGAGRGGPPGGGRALRGRGAHPGALRHPPRRERRGGQGRPER